VSFAGNSAAIPTLDRYLHTNGLSWLLIQIKMDFSHRLSPPLTK
jgi:hypothetical protein